MGSTSRTSSASQLALFDLPPTEGDAIKFKALRDPVWTEHKARLIERYLYYFVLVTKHGAYIDGFAGPQQPNMADSWAAKLVLETEPRWLRSFFLCDIDKANATTLNDLKAAQPAKPKRHIQVFNADFNDIVEEILKSPKLSPQVATFCLLDQRTFECHWKTVQALAAHKPGNKVELFYFLGTGWLQRAISGVKDTSILERWWGRRDWQIIRDHRGQECANLFCRRFKAELGYATAYAWPIYERTGTTRVMYHMIHATDHPDAPHLMARAYRKATQRQEPAEQFKFLFESWQQS